MGVPWLFVGIAAEGGEDSKTRIQTDFEKDGVPRFAHDSKPDERAGLMSVSLRGPRSPLEPQGLPAASPGCSRKEC